MEKILLVPLTCSALLTCIIFALIFSGKFRDDMLKPAENETKFFGILTVKGTAMLTLCALLIGGMTYPLVRENECTARISELKAQLIAKYANEITFAQGQNLDRLKATIDRLKDSMAGVEASCQ
ncbi:hypothetical protein [Pseudomonas sp. C2B4]|uniref:hypothetical protein n=1 Tax=Pseudomonas sp. C2B4 TaxID=2735270 RepID=UPI0015865727|nr:hypothetical protein [Pseudomonas sp. C2B4]NUU37626.1 hypothetical protein [Pseudomonas sp. C2B4]